MYLKKSDADELLKSKFGALATSLRGKNYLLADLSRGDDWSFVIKCQTLIESAVTQAVLSKIGEDALRKTIQAMPLISDTVSKINLSRDLGLTTSPQRRFITCMATLRNHLAHNPDYGNFTFGAHIFGLNKDQRKEWQKSIPWFAESPGSMEVWSDHAVKNPKSVIYVASFMLVGLLEVSVAEASFLRRVDELSIATTTELLRGGTS